MSIQLVPACDRPEEIRGLFEAYTAMLVEKEPAFQHYLSLQHYEEELRHLEGKYGAPAGRLYMACCDGEPAGCVGLRQIDHRYCEMKRLYVSPAFRGHGIGRMLVERIIADAREIGYAYMRLDTLPSLHSAVHMYQAYGFYEIEKYNDNPLDSFVYMELDLRSL